MPLVFSIRYSTALVKHIFRYSILFDAFVNGIFYIRKSKFLFMRVYCLCIEMQLILHTNFVYCNFMEFVSSSTFLVEALKYSTFNIVSSGNSDNFMSSFSI